MFVGIQTRRHRRLLWATPLLFATLWVAYIVSAMRAPAGRIATALDWGVLTGGLDTVPAWQAAMADGSVLRLVSGLFLHADWAHLLGNLVLLLIFGLPAGAPVGWGRVAGARSARRLAPTWHCSPGRGWAWCCRWACSWNSCGCPHSC